MSRGPLSGTEQSVREAAAWVARLSRDDQGEADWLAFETWLGAASGNRAAFDRAQSLWLTLDRQSEAILADLPDRPSPTRADLRRRTDLWAAGAVAGATVAILAVVVLKPIASTPPTIYVAAKGQPRDLTLADGTRVELNGGSRIAVRLGRSREVALQEGEAAFDVVHDPGRPFLVRVGDRTLRDLGTQFDVLRHEGRITVTVRQGEVEVAPAQGEPGQTVSLTPGRRLDHREGDSESVVSTTQADEAFAWRKGQLIYRDRPLSEVASDLDRYLSDPVRVEGDAAALRFTGVLTIGDDQAMIRRLAALVPVSASHESGVIILRGRDALR
jgi:transmembrane sensor